MSSLATGVRRMTAADLDLVRAWRNRADIRQWMFTQHEIGAAEHAAWFDRASQAADRCLLIYEEAGVPRGFVHFSNVAPGAAADWGFYTSADAPKGTGRALGHAALDYAFDALALHKVCGQMLASNAASIRFHQSLHFTQEGVLRAQYFIGGVHLDLLCFGLLVDEWRAARGKGSQ